MKRGGALPALRRERQPLAALGVVLLVFQALLVAFGIAGQAALAAGAEVPSFITCLPSGKPVSPSGGGTDGDSLPAERHCVAGQPPVQSGSGGTVTLPCRRYRPPPQARPRPLRPRAPRSRLRPPNRAPPFPR